MWAPGTRRRREGRAPGRELLDWLRRLRLLLVCVDAERGTVSSLGLSCCSRPRGACHRSVTSVHSESSYVPSASSTAR